MERRKVKQHIGEDQNVNTVEPSDREINLGAPENCAVLTMSCSPTWRFLAQGIQT
jgi:hypothetical protein